MRIECSDEGFFSLQECQDLWHIFQTEHRVPFMSAIMQKCGRQNDCPPSKHQKIRSDISYQTLLSTWQTRLDSDELVQDLPTMDMSMPQEIGAYFDFLADYTLHTLRTKGESFGLEGAFLRHIDSLAKKPLFIELLCVDSESMRELNAQYMQKDYPTDVLSFPLELEDIECEQCLGSIALNLYAVCDCAMQYRHNMYAEISLLLVHAILHILGLDHESDNGEQRAIEQHIMEELCLPQSLIVRVE